MSVNEEYYYPTETKSVNFRTTSAFNCAAFGCVQFPVTCPISDVFAETSLTGSNQELHRRSGHYDSFSSGFIGDTSMINVGSCTWEFHRLSSRTPTLPDGETQRRGTVRGTCTIAHGAEQCNDGYKDGPLCGGMIVNIEAGWYRTPNAWWTETRTFPLANDGLEVINGVAYPSCCWLDAVGLIQDNALCATFPYENNPFDRRPANASISRASSNNRALLEADQIGDMGTANYGYDDWTGTYYLGSATVIWGTWHATNMETGEKWEDEGTMQWVVEVIPDAIGNPHTGTPPGDRYQLEPNSVRFEFNKKKDAYGYSHQEGGEN